MAQGKKLTQEFVEEWLRENRPDLIVDSDWVYENCHSKVLGTCRVCGTRCAPEWTAMYHGPHKTGHCTDCAALAIGASNAKRILAEGEAKIRATADAEGLEVVKVFTVRTSANNQRSGYQNVQWATIKCDECDQEWDVRQNHFCNLGTRCPSCAEFGYSTDKPGAMYLLVRTVDGVEQRQYGISNDWKTRTAGYKRFGWRLKDVVIWPDGQVARDYEDRMNALVREVGRTVEPDHISYKNTEAFVDGVGIPMFVGIHELLAWLDAPTGSRYAVAV